MDWAGDLKQTFKKVFDTYLTTARLYRLNTEFYHFCTYFCCLDGEKKQNVFGSSTSWPQWMFITTGLRFSRKYAVG